VSTVSGARERLAAGTCLGIVARRAVPAAACERWTAGVLTARDDWTADFDGDQFCLGRAFYTHLETDRAGEYFGAARASDALVEKHAPGLQRAMRELIADAVGGRVVARTGWCSAGVHVFPARGHVARSGGVVHFDTEGLAEDHLARREPAISLVLMLRPPLRGGGLRLWPLTYDGQDDPDPARLRAGGDVTLDSLAGDAVVFDSYRLHQIEPFEGDEDRVSATLHAAEVDVGLWETWF
jgi:hypothetical protein